MPSVAVYIREEDYEKWKAIDKKADWISKHLNAEATPARVALEQFPDGSKGVVITSARPDTHYEPPEDVA